MRKHRNRLAHRYPRRSHIVRRISERQHRRFCREVHAWADAFFAVRSQLDPERLARYARC